MVSNNLLLWLLWVGFGNDVLFIKGALECECEDGKSVETSLGSWMDFHQKEAKAAKALVEAAKPPPPPRPVEKSITQQIREVLKESCPECQQPIMASDELLHAVILACRASPAVLIGWGIEVTGVGCGVVMGTTKSFGGRTKHIVEFGQKGNGRPSRKTFDLDRRQALMVEMVGAVNEGLNPESQLETTSRQSFKLLTPPAHTGLLDPSLWPSNKPLTYR